MKADFARWNHVLIPATKSERDRYRGGRVWRRLQGVAWMAARTTREGRVLLAVSFVAASFAIDVVRTSSHELVIASASLVLASLAFTRAYRLDGVRVELSTPRRVTVGEELTFAIDLRNEGDAVHTCVRVERPLLPWDGTWTHAPPRIARVEPGARVTALARARFVERGEHHIDRFRVAALLPMGLSQGPPIRTDGARFVVVPKVARVTSIGGEANRAHHGSEDARASRAGDAQDLRGVRAYRPGDSVRNLHARSWARHGEPMVREYQQEHVARVGVVIDNHPGAATPEHLEAALSLAAGVVARAGETSAPVEWLFAGRDAHHLTAATGSGTLDQALDVLAGVPADESFAAERVLARLEPMLDRLSRVVIILLAWDAGRAALVSTIRSSGVACRVVVIGQSTAGAARTGVTAVAIEAITRGRAIAL